MDSTTNERNAGLTFPGFFGVLANRYFHETGASKEHLARVALKNRENAVNNPLAQFQKPATLEEIMSARMITDPLGLFDCSPMTDGAAAVVISRKKSPSHATVNCTSFWPYANAGKSKIYCPYPQSASLVASLMKKQG